MSAAKQPGQATPSSAASGSIIRPYGDTTGDGMVQLSFTLPLPHDKKAEGAAKELSAKFSAHAYDEPEELAARLGVPLTDDLREWLELRKKKTFAMACPLPGIAPPRQ